MGIDLSFLNEDSTHTAGGADAYPPLGASQPWGVKQDKTVKTYGAEQTVEGGFYDQRDDMVGGSDTRWNATPGSDDMSAGNWSSYGDVAPVWNSTSGLNGAPGPNFTHFSGTMSQSSLAGGENPDTPYGH